MRELIVSVTKKDLVIKPFKASGPGGQHKNKTESAIRMSHPASGTVVIATESRHQGENKKMAIKRLAAHPRFKKWVNSHMESSEPEAVTRRYTYREPDITLEARKLDRE